VHQHQRTGPWWEVAALILVNLCFCFFAPPPFLWEFSCMAPKWGVLYWISLHHVLLLLFNLILLLIYTASPQKPSFSATSKVPELNTGHYASDYKWKVWTTMALSDCYGGMDEEGGESQIHLNWGWKTTIPNDTLHWDEKYVLVCACQGTGGVSSYEKKKPTRGRKVPTKRIKCPCHLVVKT